MKNNTNFAEEASRARWFQVSALLTCWSVLIWFHWSNDGLWFQGDAPRHAITGLFWRDLLVSGWSQPLTFTREYYARYPTICPNMYPPVFYLLEAAAFCLCGPYPAAAKGVVLLCSLGAGFYLLAWLRRWIEPAAGIAAGLVLLTPGIITWSNAIMPNMPAVMFAMGGLFHVLKSFEATDRRESQRQLLIGSLMAVLGILTHPLVAVVVLVGATWMLVLGRCRILVRPSTLAIAGLAALLLIPVFAMLYRWSPNQFAQLTRQPIDFQAKPDSFNYLNNMKYYARELIIPLTGIPVLVGASAGLIVGLIRRRHRMATILLAIWVAVPFLVLSLLWAKDNRYLLIACPPLSGLIAIALIGVTDFLAHFIPILSPNAKTPLPAETINRLLADPVRLPENSNEEKLTILATDSRFTRSKPWQLAFSLLLGTFAVINLLCDPRVPMPSVRSLKDCTVYLEQISPCEPVLYHGRMQGVYTFHLSARDPGYQRQMVTLRKLFGEGKQPAPDVQTMRDIILAAGPRWLVVETPIPQLDFTLPHNLREFLKSADVELVNRFPHPADHLEQLNVYRIVSRFQQDANQADCFDLPQEIFGKVVDPIRRKSSNFTTR